MLWVKHKGLSIRHSELTGATAPTLAEFRELRHIATHRTTDSDAVPAKGPSNEELEQLEEVLSTLTPSRVRFLYRQRWEMCRLNPGDIPRLADVQFLERTLRVLDTWNRQKIDVG